MSGFEASPDAPPALRLASRCNAIRRWKSQETHILNATAGTHRWRKALQTFHADTASTILKEEGFAEVEIQDVRALILMKNFSGRLAVAGFGGRRLPHVWKPSFTSISGNGMVLEDLAHPERNARQNESGGEETRLNFRCPPPPRVDSKSAGICDGQVRPGAPPRRYPVLWIIANLRFS